MLLISRADVRIVTKSSKPAWQELHERCRHTTGDGTYGIHKLTRPSPEGTLQCPMPSCMKQIRNWDTMRMHLASPHTADSGNTISGPSLDSDISQGTQDVAMTLYKPSRKQCGEHEPDVVVEHHAYIMNRSPEPVASSWRNGPLDLIFTPA